MYCSSAMTKAEIKNVLEKYSSTDIGAKFLLSILDKHSLEEYLAIRSSMHIVLTSGELRKIKAENLDLAHYEQVYRLAKIKAFW